MACSLLQFLKGIGHEKTFDYINNYIFIRDSLACDSAFECFQKAQEINKFLKPVDSCFGELEKNELEPNNFNQAGSKTESDSDIEKKLIFDKDSWKYVLAGVAMAPPAFILGTAIHEGGTLSARGSL